ncbi:uncharacterized protein CPUR_08781 [Claviceps purpurea 20.1]|uniref:HAT C-terminal dimerisation domain-containing protein n=1 Tax=Claviceps purpurea (strain 20.1) TaxID=1111077 RepID=M1VZD2_CLAP2|nr:uncharacterized protein CPUR_08781 [Claviceps purpurea 20.1]
MIGWSKLDKYYGLLDDSPLYATAVLLNPCLGGITFLEKRWSTPAQKIWLQEAKSNVSSYWKRWYRDSAANVTVPAAEVSIAFPNSYSTPKTASTNRAIDPNFVKWLNVCKPSSAPRPPPELERYYALSKERLQGAGDDPILWWMANRVEFPTLSQMALDTLAIPAMAADCERAFSAAKLTLTSQRHAMLPKTLEKVQCVRNWVQRGAITMGDLLWSAPSKS